VKKTNADKTGLSQYLKYNRGKTQVGKQMAHGENRRLCCRLPKYLINFQILFYKVKGREAFGMSASAITRE
jgi:hypothetical protein